MRGIPKVGVLLLVLVIALAGVGVGFAHWSKALYIEGTVSTGTLDAVWSLGSSYDSEPLDKDVSYIECWLDPLDPTGETLIVEVVNAYPCIDYYQDFDITNTGTIPLHIDGMVTTSNCPPCCTLEITDLSCTQLHPDESAYGTIHVHLCQDAEQGATYTFSCEVTVTQWNVGP